MTERGFTREQIQAIETNGNVLVLAGAGTGKTRTLVERCVTRLLDSAHPSGLSEMLLVTFTEAAAAEMKSRIRERLEEEHRSSPQVRARIEHELSSLDRAAICTLHSFCLRLVKEYFYELHLDPQITVLSEAQAGLLMEQSLDDVLRRHIGTEPVQSLMQAYGDGAERSIHALIFKLHEYAQTREHPELWFAAQETFWNAKEPAAWKKWFMEAVENWRTRWSLRLKTQPAGNFPAHELAQRLAVRPATPGEAEALLSAVCAADADWDGVKTKFRRPIKHFFEEAAFLGALIGPSGNWSPLEEDWAWVRPHIQTILKLLREFSIAFAQRKRDEAALDFHDFEQFALELLLGSDRNAPTSIARAYWRRFKWVMVDECQDINPSQDAILRALSGDTANRFLVGDLKQSIYRFRLADPRIFQKYEEHWRSGNEPGAVIPLSENFRSRESLLGFVNAVFATLMRREIGNVEYDSVAQLRFANLPESQPIALAQAAEPCVEIHLLPRDKNGESAEPEPEEADTHSDWAELNATEKEARLVAGRLGELHETQYSVWDREHNQFRPVNWKDIVVLMRAPTGKTEAFARAFHEAGIPFQAQQGGFYDSMEILDITSLLEVLDNPLNDVPTLAVLRSPFAGLSLDELATIRMANPAEPFWLALKRWHEISSASGGDTFQKVDRFLQQFSRWRQLSRESTISERVETILSETHYMEWLLTQDRAAQRNANVQRFLALAQQFDPFQRLGLQRFLRFIRIQKEAEQEREPLPVDNPNVVRLMSIHQSKGLEFPVVVLPDIAKRFNFQDLGGRIIIDEALGLCPKIQPPGGSGSYPSLAHWMAQQRQRPELLGEELRLLYVAMTRAQDRLILIGTASLKSIQKWSEPPPDEVARLLAARSYLDWLGPVLAPNDAKIANNLFTWQIHEGEVPLVPRSQPSSVNESEHLDQFRFQQLVKRLEWQYDRSPATTTPAKQNATSLARLARYNVADESQPMFAFATTAPTIRRRKRSGRASELSAADIGTVYHRLLQLLPLAALQSRGLLISEAEKLERSAILSPEERLSVDFEALLSFGHSDLGRKILAHSQNAHREIPFTARFSASALRELQIPADPGLGDSEFIVVRGAIDLAVVLPKEIWLVDFKTDAIAESDLPNVEGQYRSQLKLYSAALARIYRRPVTEAYLYFLTLQRAVRVQALPNVN